MRINAITIRVIDVFISITLILLTIPLFIFVAILISIDSPGTVFFKQKRLGLGGIEFTILKFRTMDMETCLDTDSKWSSEGDVRVTGIGRMLRKYHLDELPQLLNILNGDMSFVGPRPFRARVHKEIKEIEPNWDSRLSKKPGLTGFAQVHASKGSDLNHHAEKLNWDMKNITPTSYITLIFQTFFKILSGSSH